jgi:hypothetical protein
MRAVIRRATVRAVARATAKPIGSLKVEHLAERSSAGPKPPKGAGTAKAATSW